MSEELKQIAELAQKAAKVVDEKLDEKALDERIKGHVDVLTEDVTKRATDDFTKKYAEFEQKFNENETRQKGLEAKLERLGQSGGKGNQLSEEQVEHRQKFYRDFLAKGNVDGYRDYVNSVDSLKALTVSDDEQAGYLLSPATLEAEIARIVTESSPVRQYASVRSTTTLTYERNVNVGGSAAVWEDNELDAASENSAQSYKRVKFDAHALRALYVVGPNMLADSMASIETEFGEEMGIQFGVSENNAYILGNGVGKPRGILTYTNTASGSYTGAWESIEYYATGASGDFAGSNPTNVFIDVIHAQKDQYRANSRFYMNRSTLGSVRKIKDGDGRPIFQWDSTMPATIAGEPFTTFEDMPDIAANSFSIMYADLARGYQITDREGTSIMRDPYSSKPSVEFMGRKRTGGAVKMFECIKLMKFGTS